MNYPISFKNDESGAVTVDWVVLTAAIVGIGIAVVATISSGVTNASEGINSELEVASDFTFSFGGSDAMTFDDYVTAANGGVPLSKDDYTEENEYLEMLVYMAIQDDRPEGYYFNGSFDPNSGYPIYSSLDGSIEFPSSIENSFENSTVSVGGEVFNAQAYYTENPEALFGPNSSI